MKKLISISLLVLYLISTTELHELAKLPVLIAHFNEHKSWNPDTTFLGFMAHHYAKSIEGNVDADTDRKLPFKSDQSMANHWVGISTPIKLPHYHFKSRVNYFMPRQDFVYKSPFRASSLLVNIWQPPKC